MFGQTAPAPAKKPVAPGATKAKPASTAQAAPTKTGASDPAVITIGSEVITKSEFETVVAGWPDQAKAQVSSPEGKRQFAERLAEMRTLAREARRLGFDQKPEVKQQIALQAENVLAASVYESLLAKAKPAPDQVQKFYEENKNQFEQAKARHILIRFQGSRVPVREGQKDMTEAESLAKAQEVRKQILAGEDFAKLAKTESDDSGSGANGGDLGSFARGRMVPEFDQVVWSIPIGEVSEPLKTQFGYHLLQVQERGARPLAEVQGQIEQRLQPEAVRKMVNELKAGNKIVLDPAYFPAPAPAVAPAKPATPRPATPKP